MTRPKPYEDADDELVGGNRGHYDGDIHNNVRHGNGTYVYANTFFKYEGEYVNGQKHGQGRFFLGDGSVYTGSFTNGEIEGHGQRLYPDDSTYTGEYRKGEMDGEGNFEGAGELPSYQGTFRSNQRHGKGVMWFKNGDRYEGMFANNRQHDPNGTLYMANGDVYEGGWEKGERSGQGKLVCVNGEDSYEGSWAMSARNGEGTQIYASGITVTGVWKDDHYVAKPRYLQLFTERPSEPEPQAEADQPIAEPEPGAEAEPEPEPAVPTAPPLFPARLEIIAGEALPALSAEAVLTPAAEIPKPPLEEGEEPPEPDEGEEPSEPELTMQVVSKGEAGRRITVSLQLEPEPEPEPEPEDEAAVPEAEAEAEEEAEEAQAEAEADPVTPEPVFASFVTSGGELATEVTVNTEEGIAAFQAGTLRISAETLPGTYALLVQDKTAHADPGDQLTACRLTTELATSNIIVTVMPIPIPEAGPEDEA